MKLAPAVDFKRPRLNFRLRFRFAIQIPLLALAGALTVFAQARPATAPAPPDPSPTLKFPQFASGKPIHMIAYGDMRFTDPARTQGTNPRVRKWLAERVAEEKPEVLLLTGDMPYTGAKQADWDEFQLETAAWRAENTLQLPTTGNHEIYGGAPQGIANYLKAFPSIKGHRFYSALLGSVEVIGLDCTASGRITDPQARWFQVQLDHLPRQVEFLFILYHMPWMADAQSRMLINVPGKESLILRGILEARLDHIRAKVVVFNGHIHNYERFERKGVEYIITGGGGAEPYPILLRGRSDLYRDTGFPVYHYLTVDVADHKLHAVMWKVKDPDAPELSVEQKDEFTIETEKPVPAKPGAPKK